jgi:hypothetical protein
VVFQVMRRYGIEEPFEKLKDVTKVLWLICRVSCLHGREDNYTHVSLPRPHACICS